MTHGNTGIVITVVLSETIKKAVERFYILWVIP